MVLLTDCIEICQRARGSSACRSLVGLRQAALALATFPVTR